MSEETKANATKKSGSKKGGSKKGGSKKGGSKKAREKAKPPAGADPTPPAAQTPPPDPAPAKGAAKAKSYTVARGAVQLGRTDVRRKGAAIEKSELRPQDLKRFLRDGTITAE